MTLYIFAVPVAVDNEAHRRAHGATMRGEVPLHSTWWREILHPLHQPDWAEGVRSLQRGAQPRVKLDLDYPEKLHRTVGL